MFAVLKQHQGQIWITKLSAEQEVIRQACWAAFIVPQKSTLCWLVLVISIGFATLMIGSLLQVMFPVLVPDLSLGLVRINVLLLFLQLKQSIE
jgi:hypothetical protein